MSGESNGYPVKVVIINTEYIETDARSFKAVVQRLTGKDSKVEVVVKPPPPAAAAGGGMSAKTSQPHLPTDNVPFNDFDCDRLLFNKELSPFDELYALYAQ